MDAQMPKMDGFAACTQLRQQEYGCNIPVIMVTGLDDSASIQKAYEAGATDFVTKPINWPILCHRVQYMLRASQNFEALRRSEARLSQAQQIAHLGNWEQDLKTKEWYWSDEVYRIFNLKKPITHEKFINAIHSEDQEIRQSVVDTALQNRHDYLVEYRILLPDGSERVIREQGKAQFNGDGPVRLLGITQDISQRKQDENRIRSLSYYDTLTGLPNRLLFKKLTYQAVKQAQRNGTQFALLYLDLDRFKRINDTLGHSAGDELLKVLSDLLVKHLRAYDYVARGLFERDKPAPIARFGGDEFTILVTDLNKKESLINLAKRISEVLSGPLTIRGSECFMTSSMGIAIYPEDGDNFETLLKHAGTALAQAKQVGRNGFQFYAKSMNAQAFKHLRLEGKLRNALEGDELILYYQPQMDIQTEKIIGFEALLRWELPGKGLVPPGDFIPLAEETDLIIPIGDWVLKQACAQSVSWQKAGFEPVQIAVNLSGRQFIQEGLLNNICQILDESGLSPECLEIEITETTIMQNLEATTEMLREMQAAGLKISMDDFGTGYSSMSYLKQFPLNTLKIDRSFVMGITEDETDAAITQTIISLAHSLHLHTIAEGVETKGQLELLKKQGCQQIQGYLISRPLPPTEVVKFLTPSGRA